MSINEIIGNSNTINEREYWQNITHRCERKYEYLIDKIALNQSEEKININRG